MFILELEFSMRFLGVSMFSFIRSVLQCSAWNSEFKLLRFSLAVFGQLAFRGRAHCFGAPKQARGLERWSGGRSVGVVLSARVAM